MHGRGPTEHNEGTSAGRLPIYSFYSVYTPFSMSLRIDEENRDTIFIFGRCVSLALIKRNTGLLGTCNEREGGE